MTKITKIVGERIRYLRNERGWSQEELAHRANIHPSYMGTIERGEKSPTVESLEKIVNALGITFEELFRFISPGYEEKDTATLCGIFNKLSKRSIKDQKIILSLIDTLLPWKDDHEI